MRLYDHVLQEVGALEVFLNPIYLQSQHACCDNLYYIMPTVECSFTGAMETHSFAGVLIDMDGTIIDSTDAIVKHWHKLKSPLKWDVHR